MILSIGEVLFDCYKEKGETKFLLGGAPFNVAYDVRKLFGTIIVSTPVGVNKFKHASINTWYKSKLPVSLYCY